MKVWNYSESVSTITAEYDEEALALAFHPSGFHLVVAFQDKIRMLNIFDDHLLTYKEINNIKVNFRVYGKNQKRNFLNRVAGK